MPFLKERHYAMYLFISEKLIQKRGTGSEEGKQETVIHPTLNTRRHRTKRKSTLQS